MTGVAVVKLNLEWFQSADASEPLIVTDDHGVIFLSSVPAWKYHTVRPLPKNIGRSDLPTRQYAQQTITPLPVTVVSDAEGQRADRARRRRAQCAELSRDAPFDRRAGLATDHDGAARSGRKRARARRRS